MKKFEYITDYEGYEFALDHFKRAPRIALDAETMCRPEWETKGGSALDPRTGQISLLILYAAHLQCPVILDIVCLGDIDYSYLEEILCNTILVGANLRFDLKFLKSTFGFLPQHVIDVIVLGKLISNATGSKFGRMHGHGYADLCRDYLDKHISGKGTLQASTWAIAKEERRLDNEWWLDKLTYAAADVKYLFDLSDVMTPIVSNPLPTSILNPDGVPIEEAGLGMSIVYELEMEYVPLVAEMEYAGFPFSTQLNDQFQTAVQQQLDETGTYLCHEFDLELQQAGGLWSDRELPSAKAAKILRSPVGLLKLVKEALRLDKLDNTQALTLERALEILEHLGTQSGGFSFDFISDEEEEVFEELLSLERAIIETGVPVMKAILEYKKLTKQLGMNLAKFVNPATGRIHCGFDQLGAATGRTSSARPNMQQISSRTQVRMTRETIESILDGHTKTSDNRPARV